MIPAFPVYLFDVDGTLLDSAADICGAVCESLAATPAAGIEPLFVKRYIGRHLFDLYEDLMPGCSPEFKESLLADYRRIYHAREHRSTKVFPGVAEGLSRLGGRKSTATTKGTPTTREVLDRFALSHYFDHVQGTDGFPAKPSPEVILRSLAVFGVEPKDCLLVGDSATDMAAGRAAGVKICAVRYGYGDAEEIARFKPDYSIADLRELAESLPAV